MSHNEIPLSNLPPRKSGKPRSPRNVKALLLNTLLVALIALGIWAFFNLNFAAPYGDLPSAVDRTLTRAGLL